MKPSYTKPRRVGLIGWPVAHSISPAMHNAAFAELDLDWSYSLLPVEPDNAQIAAAIRNLNAQGFVGANVTIPHKQSVRSHLTSLSDAVHAIGAVNTIRVAESGDLIGDNTDAAGFLADLVENEIETEKTIALVLGAGGSARAVAYALASAGASRIAVAARSVSKATRLVSELTARFDRVRFIPIPLAESLEDELEAARLVVNCTPVGMARAEATLPVGIDALRFRKEQVFYDLVYNPRVTPLIERARECGARALDGLGMLVHQGARSFEIWTGKQAPVDVMRRAALEQLSAR